MKTRGIVGLAFDAGEFPSGQRGQTVNLLSLTSVVRIHLPPPEKKHLLSTDKRCFFSTKSVLLDGINPPTMDEIRLRREQGWFSFYLRSRFHPSNAQISLKYTVLRGIISLINKSLAKECT